MKNRSQKGFTLIELMIVVAIIGILAAVALPKFSSMIEKSKEGATKGNIGAIKSAVSIYYGDINYWPTQIDSSATFANPALATSKSVQAYMDSLPQVKISGNNPNNPPNLVSANPPTGGNVTYLDGGTVNAWTLGNGWRYDSGTGNVWVNSTLADSTNGKISYTMFGY